MNENKTLFAKLIVRGGTTAEWENANPVPEMRELCAEYKPDGTFEIKIGDGVTAWVDLPYVSGARELADLIDDATHRTVTDAEKAAWNAKQNALTVDTTPTAGSTNPVTSGGVATALAGKADTSSVPHASTDLSDGSDLLRGNDTVTINGGGV